MTLETVDLPGVEILAADVTIHGRGSPPEGDRYSIHDLRRLAEANRELEGELRPRATIGHESSAPAVGRLTNVRVAGDKLLADVKEVPRRFAELVKVGAFPSRSVELSRVTSKTGRRFERVVSALAFLGGRQPAVRGLADIETLYEGDLELVRAYELSAPAATESIVDEAIDLGVISEGQREATMRLLASAPEQTEALLNGMGLAEHREYARSCGWETPRRAQSQTSAEQEERRELAALLGCRPEDVI